MSEFNKWMFGNYRGQTLKIKKIHEETMWWKFLHRIVFVQIWVACEAVTTHEISAPRPECTTDSECPDHLACIQEKCLDPCTTLACGINAQCSVKRHRAICTCRRGFVGDPNTVCKERKTHLLWVFLKYLKLFKHFNQLDARATANVNQPWPAMTESARIRAFTRHAARMLSVPRDSTLPTVRV